MSDGQRKLQKWNPGLSTKHHTDKPMKRPKKRWEEKLEETETTKGNEKKNNDIWIKVARNRERWKAMESEYAKTAAAIFVDNVLRRENFPQDPTLQARYLNGVRLDDDEVANIKKLWMPPERRRPFSTTGARELRDFQYRQSRVFVLMESASQRADKLKPPSHESLPHFSPNPHSWSEQNPRIPLCDVSTLFVF